LGVQDSALVPLEQITEIIRIDLSEVLPIPEMPGCVMGICNWRGEMLWLVDLNDLIRYPSPFQLGQEETTLVAMVIQVDSQSIGIGVSQVNDIELYDLQSLQSVLPGLFSSTLLPLVSGILPGDGDAVLDLRAIAQCPLWQRQQGEVP
jgi:chemotaxis signal transduction protein